MLVSYYSHAAFPEVSGYLSHLEWKHTFCWIWADLWVLIWEKNPTTFTSQFWIIIFHKRILYLSPEKTHNLVFNSCGPSWVCSQPLGRAMYIYSFSLLSSLIFWLSGLLRHNKEAFVQSQCLVIFNVAPNFVCLQKMMVKLGFVQITGHFSQPSHFDIW